MAIISVLASICPAFAFLVADVEIQQHQQHGDTVIAHIRCRSFAGTWVWPIDAQII
jgi:hypothetical protein